LVADRYIRETGSKEIGLKVALGWEAARHDPSVIRANRTRKLFN
jgi:hypothetical protein